MILWSSSVLLLLHRFCSIICCAGLVRRCPLRCCKRFWSGADSRAAQSSSGPRHSTRPSELRIRRVTDEERPFLPPLTHNGRISAPWTICPPFRRRTGGFCHPGCTEGAHTTIGQCGETRYRDLSAAVLTVCNVGMNDQKLSFIVENAHLLQSASAALE